MPALHIDTVTADNVDELGFFCVSNKKHPGYIAKRAWLDKRFAEGMRVKLLRNAKGVTAGFIEYIPGAYTWRTVDEADDYLVIHCIWVHGKQHVGQGMASLLIEACVADAREQGFAGVAVVATDGRWMAGKEIFLRSGFSVVDTAPPQYQLLVREVDSEGKRPAVTKERLGKKSSRPSKPSFPHNWEERLTEFEGLHILYTPQCPYTGKIIGELPDVARRHDIVLNLWELEDVVEAREIMPSPYGMFALIHNGRLLEDHPISMTRFRNILQRDLGLKETTL